jgi:hypothetical protein
LAPTLEVSECPFSIITANPTKPKTEEGKRVVALSDTRSG